MNVNAFKLMACANILLLVSTEVNNGFLLPFFFFLWVNHYFLSDIGASKTMEKWTRCLFWCKKGFEITHLSVA